MPTYRVECVSVDGGSEYDDCRCIELIGIPSESGGTNNYTPARIHDRIVSKGHEFYVEHEDNRAYLEAVERNGTKYVRSEPNDTPEDNLLNQPAC